MKFDSPLSHEIRYAVSVHGGILTRGVAILPPQCFPHVQAQAGIGSSLCPWFSRDITSWLARDGQRALGPLSGMVSGAYDPTATASPKRGSPVSGTINGEPAARRRAAFRSWRLLCVRLGC